MIALRVNNIPTLHKHHYGRLELNNLLFNVEELERALGQKQMLIDIKDKMIEIAEETYDVDIKKKLVSKASSGSITTGKNTDTK